MCLYTDSAKTYRQKRLKKRIRTFYKVLEFDGHNLISPYMRTMYNSGWNIAYRAYTYDIYPYVIEEYALHCYTSKRKAKHQLVLIRNLNRVCIIVPVTVLKKEIIAYGTKKDVAVSRLFITKKNYRKAIKDGQRTYRQNDAIC